MSQFTIPRPVTGVALRTYLQAHVQEKIVPCKNQFLTVTRDLHVFKQAAAKRALFAIVSLRIPVGEAVYLDRAALSLFSPLYNRKMRASAAVVERITGLRGNHNDPSLVTLSSRRVAYSLHDSKFRYCVGETVYPAQGFSTLHGRCAGGIHFFLNVHDAYWYPG